MAAAAAFAQGPVASSAQQLRSQLYALVNEGTVRHVLLPPEDSPEWGGKWTSHTEHDWRRGNEMRITEVADRLQASSPRLRTTPAPRISFCVCVCACRWCKHVKRLSTRSTRSAKWRRDGSPCTAKDERRCVESCTACRRWHARWRLGAQPQQGTASSSLLHTILSSECA